MANRTQETSPVSLSFLRFSSSPFLGLQLSILGFGGALEEMKKCSVGPSVGV